MNTISSFAKVLVCPEATHVVGRAIGAACVGGERITLKGELGAGKTSFARGLAEGLAIDPTLISSPTFTIIHDHDGGRSGIRFVHVDAYRLGDTEELEALGWEELLANTRAVIALEWPERAPGALPNPHLLVEMEHTTLEGSDDEARHVLCSFSEEGKHLYAVTAARCPVCRNEIQVGDEHHPFCSKRCRMADLSNWFDGRYVVSREIEEDDLVDPDVG